MSEHLSVETLRPWVGEDMARLRSWLIHAMGERRRHRQRAAMALDRYHSAERALRTAGEEARCGLLDRSDVARCACERDRALLDLMRATETSRGSRVRARRVHKRWEALPRRVRIMAKRGVGHG